MKLTGIASTVTGAVLLLAVGLTHPAAQAHIDHHTSRAHPDATAATRSTPASMWADRLVAALSPTESQRSYGGVVLTTPPGLTVYWVGAFPARLATILLSARAQGLNVCVVPAAHSEHQLQAAATGLSHRLVRAGIGRASVTVDLRLDGLRVAVAKSDDLATARAQARTTSAQGVLVSVSVDPTLNHVWGVGSGSDD